MRWYRDGDWWDYRRTKNHAPIASYKRRANHWSVVSIKAYLDDETLSTDDYTEDEVRHHIELKYTLLRGER